MKPTFTHALTPPSETMRILIEQAKTRRPPINLIDPSVSTKLNRAAAIFSDELPEFEFCVVLIGRDGKGGLATSVPNDVALLALTEVVDLLKLKTN